MQPDNQNKPLNEKDFIQEDWNKNPMPMWLFVVIIVGIFALVWTAGSKYLLELKTVEEDNPFLQVTNREMSLFLWQNPEYMRIHAENKTGYMPGFHSVGAVGPRLESVDDFVIAPPEVLFLYHTWNRLLADYVIPRPIPLAEFKEFLSKEPEWDPKFWKTAPEEYKLFVQEIDVVGTENLQTLTRDVLPREVRLAFLGWKNYFVDQDQVSQMRPTGKEITDFISRYPHYARSYWQNIYPNYLLSLEGSALDLDKPLPIEELTSFLQSAYFNLENAVENDSQAQSFVP